MLSGHTEVTPSAAGHRHPPPGCRVQFRQITLWLTCESAPMYTVTERSIYCPLIRILRLLISLASCRLQKLRLLLC